MVWFICIQLMWLYFSFLSDKCGDNIRISKANYLTSPGYPQSYYPSQKCMWVITAPEPNQRILINFNPHFDLEDRECKWVFAGNIRCGGAPPAGPQRECSRRPALFKQRVSGALAPSSVHGITLSKATLVHSSYTFYQDVLPGNKTHSLCAVKVV